MSHAEMMERVLALVRFPSERKTNTLERVAAHVHRSDRTLWRWLRKTDIMRPIDLRRVAEFLEGETARLRRGPRVKKAYLALAAEFREEADAAAERTRRTPPSRYGTPHDPVVRLLAAWEIVRRKLRGDSFSDIARSLGVSRERVRQIYEQLDRGGYLDRAAEIAQRLEEQRAGHEAEAAAVTPPESTPNSSVAGGGESNATPERV